MEPCWIRVQWPSSRKYGQTEAGWLSTWLGVQGREIYQTFTWEAGEQENSEAVLKKFEAYIRPRKNKRIARHRLKQRKQVDGESFGKDLRLILMDCSYHDPEDILIDCIINGTSENKVQERLLDKGEDLTLAKAIEIGQQWEMSQKQARVMRGEEVPVSAVKQNYPKARGTKKGNTPRAPPVRQAPPSRTFQNQQSGKVTPRPRPSCRRCGKNQAHPWNQGKCPAIGSKCAYCGKPNHWSSVCHSKHKASPRVSTLEEQDPEHYSEYYRDAADDGIHILDIKCTTDIRSTPSDKWAEIISVNGKNVKFRIDTGARCNTLTVINTLSGCKSHRRTYNVKQSITFIHKSSH